MSARAWSVVGAFVVVAVAASFAIGRVRDAARSTEEAARAVESAVEALPDSSTILFWSDWYANDPDSIRARAQRMGGAVGAGVRAIYDSAVAK